MSFNKGCYLGQEAVFMLQVRGHVKKSLSRSDSRRRPAPDAAEITLPEGPSVGARHEHDPRAPTEPTSSRSGCQDTSNATVGTQLLGRGARAIV